MMRALLAHVSQRPQVRAAIATSPVAHELATRYVAGERVKDAIANAHTMNGHGLGGLLALAGPDDPSVTQIAEHTRLYLELIEALRTDNAARQDAAATNEVAVTPSLLGLRSGLAAARPQLRKVVRAAAAAGVPVTLDMGSHDQVDATLQLYRELRGEHPMIGVAVQARLRRTADDCRALATDGARIRVCAGAYPLPSEVTFRTAHEADLSFVRCLRIVMESSAYPMVATHDDRLIAIAQELAERTGRSADDYEFQLLHGFRPVEQRRLVDTGYRCRVYLPFGPDWYDYVTLRLASDPVRWARSMWRKR